MAGSAYATAPTAGRELMFRMAYEAPGGLLGVIADWVSARQVARTMTQTLENLRELAQR